MCVCVEFATYIYIYVCVVSSMMKLYILNFKNNLKYVDIEKDLDKWRFCCFVS